MTPTPVPVTDASLTSTTAPTARALVREWMLPALWPFGAITILFTAQELIRGGTSGSAAAWGRALASNSIDWMMWATFVPFIALVGLRFPLGEASHRTRNTLTWVGLGVMSTLLHATLSGVALYATHLLPPAFKQGASLALWDFVRQWTRLTMGFELFIFALVTGAFHATLYYRSARARQLRESSLEARLAQAELTVLRMQLHPHFFFNALNTVSSLVVSDPRTAQKVIASLGELVRLSIDHTASQEVSLREELGFVDRYLDIQHARFRKRLVVEREIGDDALSGMVPSLVLQPLVENAIRHGIERSSAGGRILILARRLGGELQLEVVNSPGAVAIDQAVVGGAAPTPNEGGDAATHANGIGLANIQARVAQLYGGRQRFDSERLNDGSFRVTLNIPYRVESDALSERSA